MSELIDHTVLKKIMENITNGDLFEKFSKAMLSAILGENFMPHGGLKDRGIDGLEFILINKNPTTIIYQCSIQKQIKDKIYKTINTLKNNKIPVKQLHYVTNQLVRDKDRIVLEIFERLDIHLIIKDYHWFESNINHSNATRNAFHTFAEFHVHKFYKNGKSFVVEDLVNDSRVYTFLRQQFDSSESTNLDNLLDTLILYALEGTDPNQGLFLKKKEIIEKIKSTIKFEPNLLVSKLDERLKFLSKKNDQKRKVNHHTKEDKFCLPYETRERIKQKEIEDCLLYEEFKRSSCSKLSAYLNDVKDIQLSPEESFSIIEHSLHRIYFQIGFEFSNFVLNNTENSSRNLEESLSDCISDAIDNIMETPCRKDAIKRACLATIREITYFGKREEKEFIEKLSRTYLLLFMLQCDPKIATFFAQMANKLNVYVGSSILVPAMSEIFLEPMNRRYWSLLRGAYQAGVNLLVNETILNELVYYLKRVHHTYYSEYKASENIYLNEELDMNNLIFIPESEILIRTYFYSKKSGKVRSFEDFLDQFCNPDLRNIEQSLIDWLRGNFNIKYDESFGSLPIDKDEEEKLISQLKYSSSKEEKTARSKAQLILKIYALRRKNNEYNGGGITGYRSWWLSSDSTTYKAARSVLEEKYPVSCCMKPSFLFNYIVLSPKLRNVEEVFQTVFPNLVGINISHNISDDILKKINLHIKDHSSQNEGRKRAKLKEFSDMLKSNPSSITKRTVERLFSS